MMIFCCSSVILLSLGKHNPLWSTQARENAPWYQHEEVGYNYRMSNVIAGVVRGQSLPSTLYFANVSRISVGQLLPVSLIYKTSFSPL